jgi:hypothetical protein
MSQRPARRRARAVGSLTVAAPASADILVAPDAEALRNPLLPVRLLSVDGGPASGDRSPSVLERFGTGQRMSVVAW